MAIRVCTGLFKGSILKTPEGSQTRPTTARVRESVLNLLQGRLNDATVLEIFAGSGAFSFEAVSLGAKSIVMVENNRKTLVALRDNLALIKDRASKSGIEFSAQIYGVDFAKCMRELERSGPYDIVWADPPYDIVGSWLDFVAGEQLTSLVALGGVFALESDSRGSAWLQERGVASLKGFTCIKQKIYGDTHINIFERQ